MVGNGIGDINSPTHVGSRSTRVDPKLFGKPSDFSETDENGGTSSRYFVTGLVSSTIQLRSGCTRQQLHLESWKSGPGSQRDGQSFVHESGHGVQERGSGCCENCDSQAWL